MIKILTLLLFISFGSALALELQDTTKNQNKEKKNQKKVVREPKVVDGQFRFHPDTLQLKKSIHNTSPNDYISITRKLHGTSWVASRLLCNKKLTRFEKIFHHVQIRFVCIGQLH